MHGRLLLVPRLPSSWWQPHECNVYIQERCPQERCHFWQQHGWKWLLATCALHHWLSKNALGIRWEVQAHHLKWTEAWWSTLRKGEKSSNSVKSKAKHTLLFLLPFIWWCPANLPGQRARWQPWQDGLQHKWTKKRSQKWLYLLRFCRQCSNKQHQDKEGLIQECLCLNGATVRQGIPYAKPSSGGINSNGQTPPWTTTASKRCAHCTSNQTWLADQHT